MSGWIWAPIVIYVLGFVFTFLLNMGGPVMPSLALLRALVWPVFWLTGWPSGRRFPMD